MEKDYRQILSIIQDRFQHDTMHAGLTFSSKDVDNRISYKIDEILINGELTQAVKFFILKNDVRFSQQDFEKISKIMKEYEYDLAPNSFCRGGCYTIHFYYNPRKRNQEHTMITNMNRRAILPEYEDTKRQQEIAIKKSKRKGK